MLTILWGVWIATAFALGMLWVDRAAVRTPRVDYQSWVALLLYFQLFNVGALLLMAERLWPKSPRPEARELLRIS